MSGYVCAVIPVIVWGITFVSTKCLLKSFSALEILIFRFSIAYVCLWILKPQLLKIKNIKTELLFLGAGISGVTVYQYMENLALSYTDANNVSIIVSICPILTAVINQIFLKEKNITPRFITGFVVAITGVSLVTLNGALVLHLNPAGDILAFTAAVCWGGYSLFITQINRLKINAITATRRMFFWALVFMVPVCMLSPDSVNIMNDTARYFRADNILNMLFLGFIASGLCFVIWGIACKKLGTVKTSLGIYVIPVITILFSYIFLGERLSLMGIAGAILTIAGLFISKAV